MKNSAFANAAILAGAAAAQLRLPLVRRSLRESSLRRREVNAEITVDALRYLVNITIGTPPQELSLELTLDSDESWVPDVEECKFGCERGAFNSTASSTFDDSDYSYFSIGYGDGSSVYGLEFTDTIRFGDAEIEGLTMGRATNGEYDGGVLAIGPSAQADESIVEKLIQASVTHSAAYSIWLDDADGDSGNLLFGAVDTSAFEAPLQRISTRPAESAYYGFPVDFSVLNYIESPGADPEVIAPQNDLPLVLVRPTDILTNLQSPIAKKIWHLAGATYDKSLGLATIPCSGVSNPDAELVLGLGIRGNATARVFFKDLVIHYGTGPEGDICVFGIQSSSSTGDLSNEEDGPWSLGGAVLRNTYVAFDLVNDEVALAPVSISGSGSRTGEVVPFPSYGAEIPRSEDADPVSDREYVGGRYGGSSGLGALGFVLVIVGVVLVVVVTSTCLCFCWYRGYCCWTDKRKKGPEAPPLQSGPILEKVVYAGALPPVLPPRDVRAGVAGLSVGELPLGCAWVSAPVSHATPASPAAPPPAKSRDVPSEAQRVAPAASPVEGGGPENQPARGSVESTAAPPGGPSTRPPSPAGSRAAEESVTPDVAGPSKSKAKDDTAMAVKSKDTPEATP